MIDALEYFRLAEKLVVGTTEAEWRSAVSRAYYAVFHVARKLLVSCGFNVKRGEQAHAYLWLRLANCGNPDLQTAANRLTNLRGDRNRADYEFQQTFGQSKAHAAVLRTGEIIRVLNTTDSTPVRAMITDAMRVYERDVLKEVTWRA